MRSRPSTRSRKIAGSRRFARSRRLAGWRWFSRRAVGFTLVELLVVITIIAILAAAATVAAFAAFGKSKDARVKLELGQLAGAVESFRAKYGFYPPDFFDQTRVDRVYYKIAPQLSAGEFAGRPQGLDRSEALVFWLSGFSPNALQPFTGAGERVPFIEFDPARLVDPDGDGFPSYLPYNSKTPYAYFQATDYAPGNFFDPSVDGYAGAAGQARPYLSNIVGSPYVNPKTYQIIAAGADDDYGTHGGSGRFPDGNGYTLGDRDNITNFSEIKLEDHLP